MRVKLHVSMYNTEGALVRLLGTMERRGHRLLGIRSEQSFLGENTQDLTIDLDCGERSPGLLARQLSRLHDVFEVEVNQDEDIPYIQPVWEIAHG